MTEQEYQKARYAIIGVMLARLAAVCLAIGAAWRGDWTGAGIMLAMVPLLHFALPVIPDRPQ